jgi:hypothetical protein
MRQVSVANLGAHSLSMEEILVYTFLAAALEPIIPEWILQGSLSN